MTATVPTLMMTTLDDYSPYTGVELRTDDSYSPKVYLTSPEPSNNCHYYYCKNANTIEILATFTVLLDTTDDDYSPYTGVELRTDDSYSLKVHLTSPEPSNNCLY